MAGISIDPNDYYTFADLAALFGCTVETFKKWVSPKEGRPGLRCWRTCEQAAKGGKGPVVIVRGKWLIEFLELVTDGPQGETASYA